MDDDTNLITLVKAELGADRLWDLTPAELEGEIVTRAVVAAWERWEPPAEIAPKSSDELRLAFATSRAGMTLGVWAAIQALMVSESSVVLLPSSLMEPKSLAAALVYLEPPVEAGLLTLLSQKAFKYARYQDETASIFREVARYGIGGGIEGAQAFLNEMTAETEIASVVDLCAAFPGRLDVAATSPVQTEWLRARLRELPAGVIRGHDATAYLADLLSLRLPVASHWGELVDLRRDGAFAQWREHLASALLELGSIETDGYLDPASEQLKRVRERMTEAAVDMQRAQSRGAERFLSFGVACAAGAVGSAIAGPVGGAIGGGAGYAGSTVVRWLCGRPRHSATAFARAVGQIFPE